MVNYVRLVLFLCFYREIGFIELKFFVDIIYLDRNNIFGKVFFGIFWIRKLEDYVGLVRN